MCYPANNGVNLTLGRYTHPKARPAQVTPNTLGGLREGGRGVSEGSRGWLERPAFLWTWGAVVFLLNAYTTVYYVAFLQVIWPLLGGEPPAVPQWLSDERVFLAVWCMTAVAVLTSFALSALSIYHAWRSTQLSTAGKVIWSVVPFVAYQPGLLAYWVWNVARPMVLQRPVRHPDASAQPPNQGIERTPSALD
jgi:hypothetical protein